MIDTETIYTRVTSQPDYRVLLFHHFDLLPVDDILAEYGKEMTWDIKAGLMGKRESRPIRLRTHP